MADILSVIGASVSLKRHGSLYFGRCPFHEDKTASFCVYPTPRRARKPFFRCFACDTRGDVIDFIRRIKGMSYREACDFLGTPAAYKPDPALAAIRQEEARREAAINAYRDRHPHCCIPDWLLDV